MSIFTTCLLSSRPRYWDGEGSLKERKYPPRRRGAGQCLWPWRTIKDHSKSLDNPFHRPTALMNRLFSLFLTFSPSFFPLFFLSLSSFYLYLYLSFPFYFEKSRFDLCRYLSASLFHSNPLALKIEFEFWFIDGFFFLTYRPGDLSEKWTLSKELVGKCAVKKNVKWKNVRWRQFQILFNLVD